ncbi:MAG: HAD family phosphatase [Anaerolineales bacterium]|uniref:HAD family hydrolase n=1 Tax=Candidatus Villigracilis vicinus TaxID=3140679 RepID=UPI003135DB29|nr:HAD family phosphatase [Anaerolineales bacterium]
MNSLPFELAIFDCDGVLVDSEPLANRVFVQIVREHGFNLDEPTYLRKFSGITLPDRISAIAEELNWTPPKNFLSVFNERLIAITEKELRVVEGIYELLESLRVPLCVASNGTRDEIDLRLRLSKLAPFFGEAIFSGMEVPNPKPAPDVYLAAALAFGVPPSRCIVIEDSIPGVTAGVRAGMRVYGHAALTPVKKLEAAGAIPFMTMMELKNVLLNKQ